MWIIRLTVCSGPVSIPCEIENDAALERWRDETGREFGVGLEKDSCCWMKFHSVGLFVAAAGSLEVLGYPERGADAGRFQELFFHAVTPWLMQRQAWECLHASAVLTGGGVVCFSGPSGRGKSTLARAWCDRGGVPYGDDAAPLLMNGANARAARIPQRLRLREPAASRFSEMPPGNRGGEAHRDLLYDLEPTLRPLLAIYYLEPMSTANSPHIERIPQAESFRLLLREAYCLWLRDPACLRKMVRNYLRLVQVTPVFRLSFPAGLDHLPTVLDCVEQNQRTLRAN